MALLTETEIKAITEERERQLGCSSCWDPRGDCAACELVTNKAIAAAQHEKDCEAFGKELDQAQKWCTTSYALKVHMADWLRKHDGK